MYVLKRVNIILLFENLNRSCLSRINDNLAFFDMYFQDFYKTKIMVFVSLTLRIVPFIDPQEKRQKKRNKKLK